MKKCIYLLALLLIPALGVSQEKKVPSVKKTEVQQVSPIKSGYTEVEWTYFKKQVSSIKANIVKCEKTKNNCAKLETFANKISKQTFQKQIEAILSSGFGSNYGSNYMTEMAKLEKALLAGKGGKAISAKQAEQTYIKIPSYGLNQVKNRIRMYEKRMEMAFDDEDDE